MSYTYKDNTEEVQDAIERAIDRGLEAIGMMAERYAKTDPQMPVDTGLARNSITHAVSGKETSIKTYHADKGGGAGSYSGTAPNDRRKAVYIGSNVEYFPYIELGGKNNGGKHVLQRAASDHKAEYKQLMKDSMENA